MNQPTVVVVGAGRGLGRGAADAFANTGATVLAIARTESELLTLQAGQRRVVPMVNDALDPDVAGEVINGHLPDVVVLAAGATPTMAPLDEQTWEQFAVNWESDVKLTHLWLSTILRNPLRPGSRVIVVSSGAALAGSPLSGGYAGAKATQRFLTSYAQDESKRRRLDITFTAVLPRITPLTNIGAVATQAYAARDGISEAAYVAQFGEALDPETFGTAVRALAQMSGDDAEGSFLLTSAGLKQLP